MKKTINVSVRVFVIFMLILCLYIGICNSCFSLDRSDKTNVVWKNDLKTKLDDKQAVIYGLVIRNFNAKNFDNNDLIEPEKGEKIGTFITAVERLDELKELGINTLHLLPVFPSGKKEALGIAGSLYSPASFTEIDKTLDDYDNLIPVYEEAKLFIDECHKRNIRVMLDVPCCGSVDLFEKQPELFLTDAEGKAVIPNGWTDIRLFKTFEDQDSKKLNKSLLDMHKQFIDMCIDLGVDGIRADVARTKPPEFWSEIIAYARKKDPEFGFLAESFATESNSTINNIPPDDPFKLLDSGFDSYYGIYNQFNNWKTAQDFHNYILSNHNRLKTYDFSKSLIGSFYTHDTKSPYLEGKIPLYKLVTGLQVTLPNTNPYFISGFESGDLYNYSFANKKCSYTDTDSSICFVHPGQLDIFNYSRKPAGDFKEISEFMKKMLKIRKKYQKLITEGLYIPLEVEDNPDGQIISYARYLDDTYLVVIANKDLNNSQQGKVILPEVSGDHDLYMEQLCNEKWSNLDLQDSYIKVKLPPAGFNLYELKVSR